MNASGLIIEAPSSYDVYEVAIAKIENGKVKPMCFSEGQEGHGMVTRGYRYICERCRFVLDVKAFKHFIENGYLDFTPTSDPSVSIAKVTVPVCKVCYKQGLPGSCISLKSYLSEKCVKYPSYQHVIWDCVCKSAMVIPSVENHPKLMKGWKKIGPSIKQTSDNKITQSQAPLVSPFANMTPI
jgi:hypothetical protein